MAAVMQTIDFDHEKLDVYRMSIEYVAFAFKVAASLPTALRQSREQWRRAAQSIPLNIAEGNGKTGPRDRAKYLEIARGSALECAAIHDVVVASGGTDEDVAGSGKAQLRRIVAMLTKMIQRADHVAEVGSAYDLRTETVEHEYEQEYEYDEARNDSVDRDGRLTT
jgi:four helix bundle protein